MSKYIYPPELKVEIAKLYCDGGSSFHQLADQYDISVSSVKEWVKRYREYGEPGFSHSEGNKRYSGEFKRKCVEAVLSGEGSVNEIVARYNISSRSVLRQWIDNYSSDKELKDYNLKQEACPKKFSDSAEEMRKSEKTRMSGRAKRAERSEMTSEDRALAEELEQLRRENHRLKLKLQEKERAIELLKKAEEIERM